MIGPDWDKSTMIGWLEIIGSTNQPIIVKSTNFPNIIGMRFNHGDAPTDVWKQNQNQGPCCKNWTTPWFTGPKYVASSRRRNNAFWWVSATGGNWYGLTRISFYLDHLRPSQSRVQSGTRWYKSSNNGCMITIVTIVLGV